ncbi:pentapeptide repeat-containing protein, partial [Streptomyces sp. WAC05292]
VESLAGAVVTPGQLVELAPALAACLGVRVVP